VVRHRGTQAAIVAIPITAAPAASIIAAQRDECSFDSARNFDREKNNFHSFSTSRIERNKRFEPVKRCPSEGF
jgi:hypothetical protein